MDTGPYILVGILVLAVILVVGIVRWVKNINYRKFSRKKVRNCYKQFN